MFLGILLGILLFFAFKFVFPELGNSRHVGITGRYHTETIPREILNMVSQGLTNVTDTGETVPGIAESWETTDDGSTWVFHLRDNLKWQDGSAITADTIQYSFEDVKIEVPDPKTIIFKLDAPFSPFPVVVSKPTFKKGLLGTGVWKVTSISLSGSFVEKLVLKRDGDKQVIRFYPSEEKTKLAFKLGQIDEAWDVIDPSPFNEWSTVNIEEATNKSRYVGIFFNTAKEDGNDLSDKKLRQSLSYAIDKSSFGFERALGPISPDSWAYNPQIKDYEYDPSHSKELLSDFSEEALSNLTIELSTTATLLPIAEKISHFWGEIGIKTNILVIPVLPETYRAFLAIYDIPEDPDQYSTWHSTQVSTNISRYNNPRIDKLLEDGRIELDPEVRKKIYLDFQRFLLEDAPAVFLYHPASFKLIRK